MSGITRRWRGVVLAVLVLIAGVVTLAPWDAPPIWLAGPQRVAVAALGWAREHVFTVAGVGLLATIAGVVGPFLLARIQRGWSKRDAAVERGRGRDRKNMLKQVRHRWITGVLEQSLTEEARIALGLASRLDVIQRPSMIVRRPGKKAKLLPPGTAVSQVFSKIGGGLLVLGVPGSGKTTALLELARDLLDKAEEDEFQPMPVVFNLIPAIGIGLFVGVCVGLFAGPGFGLLAGLIFGLLAGRTKEEPVEEVHWSWLRLRGNLAFVLVGGLCVGLLAGLVGGPFVGLVFGLVAGLAAGLISGLFTRLADGRPTPNEGIRRSARHALVFGLFVGLVLGLFVGLAFGLGVRLTGGLAGGPFVGLSVGLAFGLVSGLVIGGMGCLQQLVLRGLLAWNGFVPVRYVRFLDEAKDRLFLRRTGNGYLFVHRLLREHFAGLDTTLPPAAADPPMTLHRDPSS